VVYSKQGEQKWQISFIASIAGLIARQFKALQMPAGVQMVRAVHMKHLMGRSRVNTSVNFAE
jgi:hypothetical protein